MEMLGVAFWFLCGCILIGFWIYQFNENEK